MTEKLPASRKGWKPAFSLKIPKGETRTIRVRTRLPLRFRLTMGPIIPARSREFWVTGG